jgi:hypothetical protein
MFVPLAALTAAQLFITVADTVPTFDVTPSCRAAASASGAAGDRMETCLQSEQRARAQVVDEWPRYKPAERTRCIQTATVGGNPTYSELATCLEMTRDTRNPPAAQTLAPLSAPSTSGMAHRQPRPNQPPGPAK